MEYDILLGSDELKKHQVKINDEKKYLMISAIELEFESGRNRKIQANRINLMYEYEDMGFEEDNWKKEKEELQGNRKNSMEVGRNINKIEFNWSGIDIVCSKEFKSEVRKVIKKHVGLYS